VQPFVEKRQKKKSGTHLIGELKARKLFDYEKEEFEDINDFYNLSVIQANRINKDFQIFHSRSYRHSENSCSYLVKYIDHDHSEAFGYIEYFICSETFSSTYAYIQHIDTHTNSIKYQLLPPEELTLSDDYTEVINDGTLGHFYKVGLLLTRTN
jgi:hypothetical protein